jgi:hypothetical protein
MNTLEIVLVVMLLLCCVLPIVAAVILGLFVKKDIKNNEKEGVCLTTGADNGTTCSYKSKSDCTGKHYNTFEECVKVQGI